MAQLKKSDFEFRQKTTQKVPESMQSYCQLHNQEHVYIHFH